MDDDPFGTAELRRRVLVAWRESPSRLRADANLEADYATVGYRDRVVVELAQNAADAATRAGEAGRLLLTLSQGRLTAANTGVPLDAAGVESIAVARASAKSDRPELVGRFGVGFAAVRSVSDAPEIRSTSGAVRWSRPEAAAQVSKLIGVDAEQVPVLRLPFPSQGAPPVGYTTAVIAPLRDQAAETEVRRQLAALDVALLLSLPGLSEIRIDLDGGHRVLSRVERAGRVLLRDGDEESQWVVARQDEPAAVTWAIPVDDADRLIPMPQSVARVVRAPTPSDDPLTLPAILIASYPLEATRRRVVTGPDSDAVSALAAELLVGALASLPAEVGADRMVPTGLPDGPVDGSLHAAVLAEMRSRDWLPTAADPGQRQRARDALSIPDVLVPVLSDLLPAVLPPGWSPAALVALGVERPTVASLVDTLGTVTRPPAWWRRLYEALASAVPDGPDREALGALPVPLADGRMAIGPRGALLPTQDLATLDPSALGLRLVHQQAAHPLLARLGAAEAGARQLLEQPAVRAAVEASYDEEDPAPIAEAVLALVAAASPAAGELPWLGELALPDDTGQWRPAGELLLPRGRLAGWVVPDSPFGRVDEALVRRWRVEVLTSVGVLDGPATIRETDAVGPDHDLDDEPGWWSMVPDGAAVSEFVAVRDLELIGEAAWPQLLQELSGPAYRAAVTEPAIVALPDGGELRMPAYTAWWLSSRPVLDGRVPRDVRLAEVAPPLAELFDPAPAVVDAEFLRALGVLDSLEAADPEVVLTRLADPRRSPSRSSLRAVYRWLAGLEVEHPERLRAVRAGDLVVVPAADVVVVDAPDLAPLLGDRPTLPVTLSQAVALAETLDVALASELAEFRVHSTGRPRDGASVHDPLLVADADGVERRVAWRYVDDLLHVDGGQLAFGLGRGRAWRAGRWELRHRFTEECADPRRGMTFDDEHDLDEE